MAYSDSNYTGDRTTRASTLGFIIFLKGVLASWKSKGQCMVALSRTKTKYIVFSEVVKEVLFILQLMTFMGEENVLPIKLYMDNVGAI